MRALTAGALQVPQSSSLARSSWERAGRSSAGRMGEPARRLPCLRSNFNYQMIDVKNKRREKKGMDGRIRGT